MKEVRVHHAFLIRPQLRRESAASVLFPNCYVQWLSGVHVSVFFLRSVWKTSQSWSWFSWLGVSQVNTPTSSAVSYSSSGLDSRLPAGRPISYPDFLLNVTSPKRSGGWVTARGAAGDQERDRRSRCVYLETTAHISPYQNANTQLEVTQGPFYCLNKAEYEDKQ